MFLIELNFGDVEHLKWKIRKYIYQNPDYYSLVILFIMIKIKKNKTKQKRSSQHILLLIDIIPKPKDLPLCYYLSFHRCLFFIVFIDTKTKNYLIDVIYKVA